MIPSIKVGTEIPYLINANVWGQEDVNNSSICTLWRTLSASLFLSKQPMNQHYVITGWRNLHLLNLLLYWEAQRSQAENQNPSNFREPGLYLCRQHCRLAVLPRATALPPSSSLALALASSSSLVLSQTRFFARLALPQLSFPAQLTTSSWVSTGERTNSW